MCPVGLSTSRSISALKKGEAKLWILLVGINQYQDKLLSPLRYAAVDCQGLGEALLAATKLFPQKELIIHHDFSPQTPQLEVVRGSLRYIVSSAKAQDTVLFYFSGHGVLDSDSQQTFLCLADTYKNNLPNTGLKLQEILTLLSACTADKQLVWLDSCHSGNMTLTGARGKAENVLNDPTAQIIDLLQQRIAKSKGFYALLSCDRGQRAWEFPELGHGVFTYYLMRGLRGEAANSQGIIDADNLYHYIYNQTLHYIENTNQQVRLLNEQKRIRGETDIYPEYPLQTPKRIIEGVGELILGFEPDKPVVSPQQPAKTESQTRLYISVEQQTCLEKILTETIGPIGPILLQEELARTNNLKDFGDNLSLHLPLNSRGEFKKQIESIFEATEPSKSLPSKEVTAQEYTQIELLLRELLGSIAPILLEQVAGQFESIDTLVTKLEPLLTRSQQATLRKRLASPQVSQNISLELLPESRGSNNTATRPINEHSRRQCEQVLTNFIGPIAQFMVAKTLKDNPQLSFTQLIEALAAEIPDASLAEKFRRHFAK